MAQLRILPPGPTKNLSPYSLFFFCATFSKIKITVFEKKPKIEIISTVDSQNSNQESLKLLHESLLADKRARFFPQSFFEYLHSLIFANVVKTLRFFLMSNYIILILSPISNICCYINDCNLIIIISIILNSLSKSRLVRDISCISAASYRQRQAFAVSASDVMNKYR